MDATDVEVVVGGNTPAEPARWSTLCDLEGATLLAELWPDGLDQALTRSSVARLDCIAAEGGSKIEQSVTLSTPGLRLARFAARACRRTSDPNVVDLPLDLQLSPNGDWPNAALTGGLTFDRRAGVGEIVVLGDAPNPASLGPLVPCARTAGTASLSFRARIDRSNPLAELRDIELDMSFKCEDARVTCRERKGPP
jgi:hypothetical protein